MPDDFDSIERRFGKPAAPSTKATGDFDAIEARFAQPSMPAFADFLKGPGTPPAAPPVDAAPAWEGMGPDRENVSIPDTSPLGEAVYQGKTAPVMLGEYPAYDDLAEADALTGQRNMGNPEFRKAFQTDGKMDPAKTSAYLETIRKAHAESIPAAAAVAAHFGRAVASGTTLGFWKGGLSEEDSALLDQNPAVRGPLGQVAGAAGTVLAAANPVGPVAALSKGAAALKIPTAGAVGFGAASGIEHRSPAAALEGYGFAAGAGGIGGKLAGPTAGAVRRGLSEAAGVGVLSTASSALRGERPDWAGILAQMGFFGLASAGKVSPLSRAGKVAVKRAEAISEAVPEATPEQVAGWVSGDPKAVPPDLAPRVGVADSAVLEAHRAEVRAEELPPGVEMAIREKARAAGTDPTPALEKARKPVDVLAEPEPAPVAPGPATAPAEGIGDLPVAPPAVPGAPAESAPSLALIGKTKDGRAVYGKGDSFYVRGAGGRLGAAHPKDVAEAQAAPEARTGVPHDADVFHGTPRTFDTLDASHLGENTGAGSAKRAFFFTDKPAVADSYANFGKQTDPKAVDAWIDRIPDADVARITERLNIPEGRDSLREYAKSEASDGIDGPPGLPSDLVAEAAGKSGLATPNLSVDAGNVRSERVRFKNPLVIDAKGAEAQEIGMTRTLDAAKARGHDGVIFKNLRDGNGEMNEPSTVYAKFPDATRTAPEAPGTTLAGTKPKPRLKSADTLEAEATKNAGLAQLVRREGGIDLTGTNLTGEVNGMRLKESGTTGLVAPKGGGRSKSIQRLMDAAREEGFDIEGWTETQFVERVLADAQGDRTLNPAAVDTEKMGAAALRRQDEAINSRLAELPPEERARIEAETQERIRQDQADLEMERAEREAIQAEASGEMGDVDTSFDFGANVTGKTREGEIATGAVVRTTEKSVVLDTGQRIPKDRAKKTTEPRDDAVSAEGIEAGLAVLRGGKPGPTPKTSGEAGFLDLPTVGKAVAKVAFGAPRVVETGLDYADRGARAIVKAAAKIPGVSHAVDGVKVAAKLIREKMDPFLLPREYLSRVAEKEGREALTRHDAKDDARFLANFPDGKPLTKDHQEAATKFLTQESTREEAVSALGEEYVKRLDAARSEIDARQAELGKLEVLSPETIAKWGGKYLKRMYAVVEAQKAEGEIPANIPVGGKRIAKVYQRKDIPALMREFLGEIRDPAVLVAQTRMAQEGMIATAKFLKRVAEDPRWSSDAPRKGLSPDPLTDSKRYGALAGKYLHPRIKADIEATFRDQGGMADTIAQVLDTALSQWKFGKTVLNPGTHGRNIIGNGFYAALEGNNWADPFNWKHGIDAIKIMAAKKGDPLDNIKRALIAERIMGGDYLSADVLETAALVAKARGATWLDKMRDYMESLDKKAGKGRIFEAMPGADKVAALYQLEDVLPKVASYISKVKGRLGRPAMSHSEAAQAVRDAYPTFDATTPGRSVLHMKGLAGALTRQAAPPFIGYTLAAARTISKQALLHPVRFAAIGAALKWVMYGMSDTDEKTKRIVGAAVPKYKRPGIGAGFLPWNDDNGDRQLLDLRYTVPLGDEFQTIVDWFSDAKGVDDPGLRSIQPGPFAWTAAQLLLNKNALTSGSIDQSQERGIQPNTSDAQGARDMWRFVGQQMLPSMFPGGYSWGKIKEALSQVPIDRRGQVKRDLTLTLLDTIAGVKIRSVNVRRDQDSKLIEIDDILTGKIQRMKVLAEAKNIPEADKRREYDELQADVANLYAQSLRVRGMPDMKPGEKIDVTGKTDDPADESTPRKLFQESVKRARERLNPGGK